MREDRTMIPQVYKRLLQIGKVTGAVTFLFAVPLGVWQYVERKQETRVEQSLRFFDKFNSTPFTTYREEINKAIVANADGIREAARDSKELERFVVAMMRKNGDLEPHLWLVMDFFDALAICVIKHLCDAVTVDHLFAERANDYYILFYQYILLQRNNSTSPKFAVGLETIATAAKDRAAQP
jgi:hypothetical protein